MLALAIMALGLFSFRPADDNTASAAQQSMDVTYEVKCKTCDISFRNDIGESDAVEHVEGKWTYSFTGKQGQFAYISASNPKGTYTEVTIKRGGKTVIVGTSEVTDKSARAGIIL